MALLNKKKTKQWGVNGAPQDPVGDATGGAGKPTRPLTPFTTSRPRPTYQAPETPEAPEASAGSYEASKITGSGYDATKSNAASYDATNYEADERSVDEMSTVAGNMDKLLGSNSAYMKRAETAGKQMANKRGLLNSDFAVSAAHGAAIDRALPIAQQDAQTYNNQSLTNQGYSNDARKTNATFDNEADRFNATNEQQTNLANQEAENRASEFTAANEQQANLANQDAENRASQFNAEQQSDVSKFNATTTFNQWSQLSQQNHQVVMDSISTENKDRLIQIEMEYKRQIENEKNGSEAYRQAIDAMGQALGNNSLSKEQQQRAVDEITAQLEAYLDFNSILLNIDSSVPNESSQTSDYREQQETTIADQAAQIKELQRELWLARR